MVQQQKKYLRKDELIKGDCMHKLVGSKATIVYRDVLADKQYSFTRDYVDTYMNKTGIIVDVSDAHGECYGIVFPDRDTNKEGISLAVYWFDPSEISI